MDTLEFIRLIRESYPFPIAHAHKKTLGVLENEEKKLACLFQTAEMTIQFLALLALAQVRQDLLCRKTVPNMEKLREKLNLTTPSLGKWNTMARETMKAYWNAREQLAVPELFDVFWSWDAARQKIGSKPLDNKALTPLIKLRNDFHHGRIQSHQIPDVIPSALDWLHQFMEAIRFVADYQLVFTNRIELDKERENVYLNEFMLFTGCFSAFDTDRWKSEIQLKPDAVIFLHPHTGRHLILSPFIIFTKQFNSMPDLLVINSLTAKDADYVATLFGHVAKTSQPDWTEGAKQFAALNEFVKSLQQAAESAAPDNLPPEETAPALKEDDAPMIRKAVAPPAAPQKQHTSPYKFLDYYNPEDADIFCGRDREIRLIEQKFHNTRLLVLHGESGAGKTSLIRAGLMPRLSPEVFVPVYVRVLQNPLGEIRRELLRQLGMAEAAQPDMPLMDVLSIVTERVSKTVIIVFDQFEEFFLRFDEDVRRRAIAELAACLTAARLDVKFLFAIRSDYFALLAEFEDALPQIFTHQIHLERLTEAQAVEAVIKPAERLGIQVDAPMVQIKLLPELGANDGGIEPPLLQIVCDALYQHAQRDGRSVVDLRDYEAVGDVTGALGNYLNEKLRQFGKNQAVARAALKALVTAEGTKRASFVPELCSRINSAGVSMTEHDLQEAYLKKFVSYRLVRVDEVEGAARYELSHDYLARQIEAWIEDSERELTKALELIDRAYETYQATRVLLERSALQMLKPFEAQMALPPDKQAFVERSKTEIRKQRRGLWLNVAAALMAVALLVGGGFGYQAYQQYQEALEQRQEALRQKELAVAKQLEAQMNEIEALIQTSKTLLLAHDELEALLAGVKAGKQAKQGNIPNDLQERALTNLSGTFGQLYEKQRIVGHQDYVEKVAFNPDGALLASSGKDHVIKLWTVANGMELHTLSGHSDDVTSIAFSPDGKLLASAGLDDAIKLWQVADGRELRTFEGDSAVHGIAFSPDGDWLASGNRDGIVTLWDVHDQRPPRILKDFRENIESVAFSPDGKFLAVGSKFKNINLLQVSDGRQLSGFRGDLTDMMNNVKESMKKKEGYQETWDLEQLAWTMDSLAFSPNGKMLVGCCVRDCTLWQVTDRQILYTFQGSNAAFSPNGKFLAIGSPGSMEESNVIELWRLADNQKIQTLKGHLNIVTDVAFSPNGKLLASGSWDRTVRLWAVRGNKKFQTLAGHSKMITSVAFSPNGKLLASGSDDQTIRLWELADGRKFQSLKGHSDGGTRVMFHPNGQLLASSGKDNAIHLWQISDGRELHAFEGSDVAFSPDGKLLASVSEDTAITLWTVADSQKLYTLQGKYVAFSPDSKILAVANYNGDTITLYQVADGQELRTLSGNSEAVSKLIFHPEGMLLISSNRDGIIKFWQVADGRELRTLTGQPFITDMAISSDGRLLASAAWDGTVKLWRVTDGQELQTLQMPLSPQGYLSITYSLAFSPDGNLLALGSDRHIMLWELNMDRLLVRGCHWLHGYLNNNPAVSATDRSLCDDILKNNTN